jgi:hypothetical protein
MPRQRGGLPYFLVLLFANRAFSSFFRFIRLEARACFRSASPRIGMTWMIGGRLFKGWPVGSTKVEQGISQSHRAM